MNNPATHDDRRYAWEHAYKFADRERRGRRSDDDTRTQSDYAAHYSKLIEDEENPALWPAHNKVFFDWYKMRNSPCTG